jgi:hypothetical protein
VRTYLLCLLGGLALTAALAYLTALNFGPACGFAAVVLAEVLIDRHAERLP